MLIILQIITDLVPPIIYTLLIGCLINMARTR
jgi:hypothetical protein